MKAKSISIDLKEVSLTYDLRLGRTNNLKQFIVDVFTQRKHPITNTQYVHALNDVSLHIENGERVGILGLNGSGKSSLLKLISRIINPTLGAIHVNGSVQPLIELGAGFDPEFTGRENIFLNSYMLGFSKREVMDREKEIIEFSELGNFIDSPVKYYSSGMAVRLAFTIATMIRPEILLFDEMLSAGDAKFIVKAKKRVQELIDQASILMVVSHDISLIEDLCSRVLYLRDGKIYLDGPTQEVVREYRKDMNQG